MLKRFPLHSTVKTAPFHCFEVPFILTQFSITYSGLTKHLCRSGKSHLTSNRAAITLTPVLT
ncbi:hypothetical protein DER44DRAFT_617852, partial [Fusarium oxysporum]